MVRQTENFENIFVNIYEIGSFPKFGDMTKANFETSYFKPNEVKPYLRSTQYFEKLNVLHVNIRSIKRNFENLKALLAECELVFNIICVSETWCSNTELPNNSNLSLAEFNSVSYKRSKKSRRGVEVLMFIKRNLSYKIRKNLSESDEHKDILSLEISYKNSSNIVLSCCYKPPKGDNDILSMFLKQVSKKSVAEKKPYYLVGDLNVNCLEYLKNEKVSTFYNLLFECDATALINKPTRVAKKFATVIDNVITKNIFDESLKKRHNKI